MAEDKDIREVGIGGTRSPDDIRTNSENQANVGYHTAYEQRKQDQIAEAAQAAYGE